MFRPSELSTSTCFISTDHPTSITVSKNEKQLCLLLERQKLFKVSALKAKQGGNLEVAKEYLKTAKGFDPLIEASKCGLPVDLSSVCSNCAVVSGQPSQFLYIFVLVSVTSTSK